MKGKVGRLQSIISINHNHLSLPDIYWSTCLKIDFSYMVFETFFFLNVRGEKKEKCKDIFEFKYKPFVYPPTTK